MPSITFGFATITDDAGIGSGTWGVASDAGASDNGYASVSLGGGAVSHYLKAVARTGAAIPSDATIDSFDIKYDCLRAVDTKDHTVKLVIGGAVVGNNLADTVTSWGTTESTQTRSATVAAVGAGAITPAMVNASNFGFVLACQRVGGSFPALAGQVDYMYMTVHYTEASSGGGGAKSQCVVC